MRESREKGGGGWTPGRRGQQKDGRSHRRRCRSFSVATRPLWRRPTFRFRFRVRFGLGLDFGSGWVRVRVRFRIKVQLSQLGHAGGFAVEG
jgi:hypothetical protein